MKPKPSGTLQLVQNICRLLDDKKAVDLTVLDVSAQSSITDYLVLVTATSEPHMRALRVELEKLLDAASVHIVGMETAQESGWMVIDAFDVMIHLFMRETRERYGLERLWRDAMEIPVSKLLGTTEEVVRPKPARRRTPAKAAPKRRVKKM